MSAYPLMLEGSTLSAVVVGGGQVATRKVVGLLDAGAHVHVVAPVVAPFLAELAERTPELRVTLDTFSADHLADALFVVAATDDADVNALVAATARARGLLVNVVNAPDQGNCITPAVHRSGNIVLAVTTGRLPTAAARIRDRFGRVLDERYADAVRELSALRRALLDRGARDRWEQAADALVGADFCDRVEAGEFDARVAEWR